MRLVDVVDSERLVHVPGLESPFNPIPHDALADPPELGIRKHSQNIRALEAPFLAADMKHVSVSQEIRVEYKAWKFVADDPSVFVFAQHGDAAERVPVPYGSGLPMVVQTFEGIRFARIIRVQLQKKETPELLDPPIERTQLAAVLLHDDAHRKPSLVLIRFQHLLRVIRRSVIDDQPLTIRINLSRKAGEHAAKRMCPVKCRREYRKSIL